MKPSRRSPPSSTTSAPTDDRSSTCRSAWFEDALVMTPDLAICSLLGLGRFGVSQIHGCRVEVTHHLIEEPQESERLHSSIQPLGLQQLNKLNHPTLPQSGPSVTIEGDRNTIVAPDRPGLQLNSGRRVDRSSADTAHPLIGAFLLQCHHRGARRVGSRSCCPSARWLFPVLPPVGRAGPAGVA